MSTTQKFASFAPEDMKEGTNLFDNVDLTWLKLQFTKEAPDNYTAEGNPIFANVSFLLDGDAPEEERKVGQSYSLGAKAGDDFTISEDGYALVPNNDDAAIRKDCKFGTLVCSMANEGVPKPVLQTGDFKALNGMRAHMKRIADKERNFGEDKRTRPGQKSKFPPSTLVVTKLIAMPGEKAAATKTTAATTAAPSTSAVVESTGDVDSDTMAFLLKALEGAKNNTLQRGQVTLAVSKAAMGDANRAVYAKRAAEEDYLKTLADAGVIAYAPAEKGQPVSKAA